MVLPVLFFCFLGFIFAAVWHLENLPAALFRTAFFLGPLAPVYVLIGLVLAIPVAAGYRRSRRSEIGRRLQGVSTADLAAALLPLQHAELRDTQKIAASLIRDLRVTDTELVPAEPTSGSGSEPTPSPPSPS